MFLFHDDRGFLNNEKDLINYIPSYININTSQCECLLFPTEPLQLQNRISAFNKLLLASKKVKENSIVIIDIAFILKLQSGGAGASTGAIDPLSYSALVFAFTNLSSKSVLILCHIQTKYLEIVPDIVLDLFDEIIQVNQRTQSAGRLAKKDDDFVDNFATARALIAGKKAAEKDIADAMKDLSIFSNDLSSQNQTGPVEFDQDCGTIGGYAVEKQILEESTVWFYTRATDFSNLGIQPSKGTLLHGPPGCGKTLLCQNVAAKSKAAFIAIKIPDIAKSHVGESEKAIVELFERAKRASPCVLFLDEIDALFSDQDSDLNAKACHQFCIELDALDGRVVVLAATNHKDSVHPSILSSGRIDRSLYIGLPSDQDRREIIKLAISRTLFKSIDEDTLSQVAELTAGMTGSAIQEFLRKIFLLKLQESNASACLLISDFK